MTPHLLTLTDDRRAWLAERQSGVFATDAAGIAGVGFLDAPEIYAEKIAAAPIDREPSMRMQLGNELEPFVAKLYCEHTGGCLDRKPFRTVRHPLHPWRGCSPDGYGYVPYVHGVTLAQFKCVFAPPSEAWGEAGSDHIPDGYVIQVQHELDVCLAAGVVTEPVADVGVLFVGFEFRVYRIRHSVDLLTPLIELEREFWDRVQSRAGIDGWESPLRTAIGNKLAAIRPDTAIELGDDAAEAACFYEQAKVEAKAANEEAEIYKSRVVAMLAGAECGRLPDGRRVRQKVTHRKGFTVEPTTFVKFDILKAPRAGRE